MFPVTASSISEHASATDVLLRRGFGPRVRKLHARIGKAHHQAEGMTFSKALLDGRAEPLQLAALIHALTPAYALLEAEAPALAAALGVRSIPWDALARTATLKHDLAVLSSLPMAPVSAAETWLQELQLLARQAPHRLMAHVYVRYGGDLSGGQQLAVQANAILSRHGLPGVTFWAFEGDIQELKQGLHDGFEEMDLSEQEEAELLEEAELAFQATQRLLAELGSLVPQAST
jgi:heme oxygenase